MSRNIFYFFIFSLVPAVTFFYTPIGLGDLSIWTALGIDSLNNFKIITQDTYTVSETISMVYPVLICIIYGFLYKINGIELVTFFHAFVPTAWVFLWYRFVKKHSSAYRHSANHWDYKTISVFTMALLGCSLVYVARPALVATIPVLVSFYVITLLKDNVYSFKNIMFLLFLEIIWVNIHGSFLILPVMLIWQLPFLVLQKNYSLILNRLITIFFIFLSTLINPFTWQVIPYTWETALISKTRGLDEWFAPHYFYYPFASWYFYAVSILIVIILTYKLRTDRKFLFVLSNPFFMFWLSGFFAIRNTFFIFLILPIFVFDKLMLNKTDNFYRFQNYSKYVNSLITILASTACVLLSPFFKKHILNFLPKNYQFTYNRNYRVENINTFLNNNTGYIFNSWQYGSDLALSQKNKYFIDTRNIIFTNKVNREYDLFITKPSLDSAILKKYQFKYFLVNKDHTHLLSWLRNQSGFKLILEDGPAFLFEKINAI